MGRSKKSNNRRRDIINPIANHRLHSISYRPSPVSYGLRLYEDRRTFHPLGEFRPARSFSRWNHRLVVSDPNVNAPQARRRRVNTYTPTVPIGVAFEAPHKVLVCVRRKRRREVLHALNKTGRGSRQRRPRFSEYSKISCRG